MSSRAIDVSRVGPATITSNSRDSVISMERPARSASCVGSSAMQRKEPYVSFALEGDRMRTVEAGVESLVNYVVGLCGLLGNGVDGAPENLPLSACHGVAQPSLDRPCQPLLSWRRSLRRR
jgi:hypothetical protein